MEKTKPDSAGTRPAEQDRFLASMQRVLAENQRRRERIPADFYSLTRPANLFMATQRKRALLRLLRRQNISSLRGLRILDVGCGTGDWLLEFLTWGELPELLAGIDIDPEQVREASRKLPSADLRVGNAASLPWPDGHFDIVLQATLFSSILDDDFKRAIANEMMRVTRRGGVIIWYDTRFSNPRNRYFRGIGSGEIKMLFRGCSSDLRRVTLLPPLARWVVPLSWAAAILFEKIPILRTHILGCIRIRRRTGSDCILRKQVSRPAEKREEAGIEAVCYSHMRAADAEEVANLHSLCFRDFFLTGLGERILSLYYGHYDGRPESVCFVARANNGKVIGFVAGSLRYSSFVRSFYRRRFLPLALAIAKAFLLSPDLRGKIRERAPQIREAVTSLLHARRSQRDERPKGGKAAKATAGLASVAVDPEYRGTTVAGELFRLFEERAKGLDARRLELSVMQSNDRAIAFYRKVGWRVAGHDGRNVVFEKVV